jgi:hypothetical protein
MLARHRRGVSSAVGLRGACLLAIVPFLSVPCRALADPSADIPADWLSAVKQNIAASEYHVTWQDHTPLGDLPRAYQAPNRAQNFRTYFTPAGFRSIPRDTRMDEAPAWEWGLEWCAVGRAGAMQPVEEAVLGTAGNRVEYRRGDLLEWYVNDERGLEQGFTIHEAPSVSQGPGQGDSASPLRLEFKVGGTVHAVLTDARGKDGRDSMEFLAPGGARAVHFGGLRAADATGAGLPAWFEVQGGSMSIVVDDRGATYPITIDPLATSPNWTAESNQGSAGFGCSVATAGDVNGDGYGDVIVGAYRYDNGQTDEGRAHVYHGSAAGLSASASWTAEGDQAHARFGWAVATAGDVNGDGYNDVIVGAIRYDNGETDEGRAYVYHGSAVGLSASANWTAEGDQGGAYFGNSVATAGDVNGDGYSDVIVGASSYDNGQSREGRAYVYHGSAAGLSASANWTAESDQVNAYFGESVATAGDVDGDGYSDVIVGAMGYDNGQGGEGRAYVYHGSAAGLSRAADWTAESDQASYFGSSVATAGDVNGDGFSDVIVGTYLYDNGQTDEGRAYVYHGSAAGLSSAASWTAEGNQDYASFGYSVSTAGDVNGDGFSDVVVGAYHYRNGEPNEGRAYVYHGSAAGLSAAANWTAESNQTDAFFGYSVSTAGDVNGDGYSDVIVGAPSYSNGQTFEGRAYVYHGSAAGLSAAAGWTAESDQAFAQFGISVATAGDVNGDGYSDVIVGADLYDNGQTDEGRAYVYHGSAAGLSHASIWTAEGEQASAHFGCSVATAGDVNGDGYSDVIVGACYYDDGETDEGRAYVYHGSAAGLSASPSWTAQSDQAYAQFGISVAAAGDVNGDGCSDVIVGAAYYANGQSYEGRAYVYRGSAAGLSAAAGWTAESDQAGALFGISVATAGDVNGDGYSDVIVGALLYDNGQADEGRAFAYHGSAAGLSAAASWTAECDQAIAYFGCSVATAGDVNGDGYSDVIVGAEGYGNGRSSEGRASVYHGSAAGLSAAADWTAESDQADARLGSSVSTAGDVNGDGYSDVIVGAYYYDDGQTDEGRAYVYRGSGAGLPAAAGWTAESDQAYAYFGRSVATAGDVNGDGYGDVIVGVYRYDNGQTDEGRAFVYYGNAGGGRTSLPRQLRTDGTTPISPLGLSDSETEFRIGATMLSVYGRTRLQMEHEVKSLGTLFDGLNTVTDGFFDVGDDGQIDFDRLVSGLSPGTLYHWRVRAEYDLVRTPFQRKGPWVHVPLQGWNESDLRTAPEFISVEPPLDFPALFELRAAGPNPAREVCSVQLVLAHPGRVRAEILDASGRSVADLAKDELYPAASHVLTWDGRTRTGEPAAAGVYFVHARVDGEARARKLVFVR